MIRGEAEKKAFTEHMRQESGKRERIGREALREETGEEALIEQTRQREE